MSERMEYEHVNQVAEAACEAMVKKAEELGFKTYSSSEATAILGVILTSFFPEPDKAIVVCAQLSQLPLLAMREGKANDGK